MSSSLNGKSSDVPMSQPMDTGLSHGPPRTNKGQVSDSAQYAVGFLFLHLIVLRIYMHVYSTKVERDVHSVSLSVSILISIRAGKGYVLPVLKVITSPIA